MKLYRAAIYLLPAACIAGIALWRTAPVQGSAEPATASCVSELERACRPRSIWNDRELWWQSWPRAQKDHGTLCISCLTNVPYAMARPALRVALHESAASAPEKVLLDSVERRVGGWAEMVPFLLPMAHDGAGKTAESHSTEAVMNAVILTSYDRREGHLRAVNAHRARCGLGASVADRRRRGRVDLAGLPPRAVGVA